jgi:hypothetical protein
MIAAECAIDMCERFSMATAVCPFCRCVIRGFAATNLPCRMYADGAQSGQPRQAHQMESWRNCAPLPVAAVRQMAPAALEAPTPQLRAVQEYRAAQAALATAQPWRPPLPIM